MTSQNNDSDRKICPIMSRPHRLSQEILNMSVHYTTTTAQREMHKYAGEIARNIDAAYILCGNVNEAGQQNGICKGAIEGCSFCHAYGGVKLCYLANYQRLGEVLHKSRAEVEQQLNEDGGMIR